MKYTKALTKIYERENCLVDEWALVETIGYVPKIPCGLSIVSRKKVMGIYIVLVGEGLMIVKTKYLKTAKQALQELSKCAIDWNYPTSANFSEFYDNNEKVLNAEVLPIRQKYWMK